MSNAIIWLDCGICGRTHPETELDCRAFHACEKCGDCYHASMIDEHQVECDGSAASGHPDALFAPEVQP